MEKHYPYEEAEKQMRDYWDTNQIYKFRNDDGREVFSIDTPPPTISGSLHIGHIFSYTQAEMAARFRRMQGYNVFYPFGFDDNGLPTERLVEREKNILAKEVPRNEFTAACLDTTSSYENDFKELWSSLGFSVDWSLQYKTIEPDVQKISQRSFIELVEKGKAYRKESPVLWCTQCSTSIAQAELNSHETETSFIYIPFKTCQDELIVATTRPELLYGCVCLLVNPLDERYKKYVGKYATVPIYSFDIPIMADEKVTEKGTGVVMCATFGDVTDVVWQREYNLPQKNVIRQDGYIDETVPFIGGLKVKVARKEIIQLLNENRLIIKSETINHTVSTHERCGTEIEIISSNQWYIDVLSEKERFLQAADKINWYPRQMKSRYVNWVENLKWDWCISRQRYFGVPFPLWYCKKCSKPILADINLLPVNPINEKPTHACKCGSNDFEPETAVFDTWATSSLTPLINARYWSENPYEKIFPMSMRTQAHEIIRTWAFYTIVKSLYHTGRLPWKDIMVCGFVLAKKGEKISKSKNNSELLPEALIKKHSADAVRYWAANAKLGTDTFFDEEELSVSKRFLTKLWNASKFAISHLFDFDRQNNNPDLSLLLPADRWIIEKLNLTVNKASQLLYNYETGSARHEIDSFFWNDFCDYYIEIVKDRLYLPDKHGTEERQSGQYAIYHSLLSILKMYAIYVPHITEYIYLEFFKQHEGCASIHLLTWENNTEQDIEILEFRELMKEAVATVRKTKAENKLSLKTEMECVNIRTEKNYLPMFLKTEKDLKACLSAKNINYTF